MARFSPAGSLSRQAVNRAARAGTGPAPDRSRLPTTSASAPNSPAILTANGSQLVRLARRRPRLTGSNRAAAELRKRPRDQSASPKTRISFAAAGSMWNWRQYSYQRAGAPIRLQDSYI